MKSAEDELLLARVVVDIANGVDPGRTRLEFLRIDIDGLAVYVEAPFRDRAEFGGQAISPTLTVIALIPLSSDL